MYTERTYRSWTDNDGMLSYVVKEDESDLFVTSETDLSGVISKHLIQIRKILTAFINAHPEFQSSLVPLDLKSDDETIALMLDSARSADVGPMAAVAGAVNEYIGKRIHEDLIIENGGDIYIRGNGEKTIGLFAGDRSPFSHKIGLKVQVRNKMGICTSSGTVGHSLSFGHADAVTIISQSCALADAVATSICNMVQTDADIEKALERAMSIKGIDACIIAINDKLGVLGDVEIVDL